MEKEKKKRYRPASSRDLFQPNALDVVDFGAVHTREMAGGRGVRARGTYLTRGVPRIGGILVKAHVAIQASAG